MIIIIKSVPDLEPRLDKDCRVPSQDNLRQARDVLQKRTRGICVRRSYQCSGTQSVNNYAME